MKLQLSSALCTQSSWFLVIYHIVPSNFTQTSNQIWFCDGLPCFQEQINYRIGKCKAKFWATKYLFWIPWHKILYICKVSDYKILTVGYKISISSNFLDHKKFGLNVILPLLIGEIHQFSVHLIQYSHWSKLTKGQSNSEWIYKVNISPKIWIKIARISPLYWATLQGRNLYNFGSYFGRNYDFIHWFWNLLTFKRKTGKINLCIQPVI